VGRLARKEGTIKIVLLLVPLLVSCNPVITTTSLVHSVAKGDAFGTITSGFSLGKDAIVPPAEHKPVNKKSRAEIMEDLRKELAP